MEMDQKAYFAELNAKLDRVIDAMATKEDIKGVQIHINELREEVQMERYDRWFKEIAEKVGIQLKS